MTEHPAPSLGLHLVTLGVTDLERARRFYRAMGLRPGPAEDSVAFFHTGNVVIGLYLRPLLAADAGLADGPAVPFAGLALACNVAREEEVAALIARAVAAGGRETKAAEKVFWGGTCGYFTDPDGHLWEVAHNPFFPFDAEGRLVLPDGDAASHPAQDEGQRPLP